MKPNLGLKFEMGKKAKKEENAKKNKDRQNGKIEFELTKTDKEV